MDTRRGLTSLECPSKRIQSSHRSQPRSNSHRTWSLCMPVHPHSHKYRLRIPSLESESAEQSLWKWSQWHWYMVHPDTRRHRSPSHSHKSRTHYSTVQKWVGTRRICSGCRKVHRYCKESVHRRRCLLDRLPGHSTLRRCHSCERAG